MPRSRERLATHIAHAVAAMTAALPIGLGLGYPSSRNRVMLSGRGTYWRNAFGNPSSGTPSQPRSPQLMIHPTLAAYADIVSRRVSNDPKASHRFGSGPFVKNGRTTNASVPQNVRPARAIAGSPPACQSAKAKAGP